MFPDADDERQRPNLEGDHGTIFERDTFNGAPLEKPSSTRFGSAMVAPKMVISLVTDAGAEDDGGSMRGAGRCHPGRWSVC